MKFSKPHDCLYLKELARGHNFNTKIPKIGYNASFSSQAGPVKQTPCPSASTMDPPFHRNEPHSSSRCYHMHYAAYPPSSFPQEMPGNSVVVSTWVCLALLPWVMIKNTSVAVTTWVMIKNTSVAVTTWVVSDTILSLLSEHP
jgi:hypothetical protein